MMAKWLAMENLIQLAVDLVVNWAVVQVELWRWWRFRT
jgi:hypothetical protein